MFTRGYSGGELQIRPQMGSGGKAAQTDRSATFPDSDCQVIETGVATDLGPGPLPPVPSVPAAAANSGILGIRPRDAALSGRSSQRQAGKGDEFTANGLTLPNQPLGLSPAEDGRRSSTASC